MGSLPDNQLPLAFDDVSCVWMWVCGFAHLNRQGSSSSVSWSKTHHQPLSNSLLSAVILLSDVFFWLPRASTVFVKALEVELSRPLASLHLKGIFSTPCFGGKCKFGLKRE
eukprot:6467701-Amphidinium_carterae.1